jgi:hypothetical protein
MICKPSRALLAASCACTQTAEQQQQQNGVPDRIVSSVITPQNVCCGIFCKYVQSSAAVRRTQRLSGVQLLLTSSRSMRCGALYPLLELMMLVGVSAKSRKYNA